MAETCGVCGGEESRRGDEILFCDGCDVGVHLGCYGVEELPADDEAWYCDACASEAAARCGVCRGRWTCVSEFTAARRDCRGVDVDGSWTEAASCVDLRTG